MELKQKDRSKNNDKMFEGHGGIEVFPSPFTFFRCAQVAFQVNQEAHLWIDAVQCYFICCCIFIGFGEKIDENIAALFIPPICVATASFPASNQPSGGSIVRCHETEKMEKVLQGDG